MITDPRQAWDAVVTMLFGPDFELELAGKHVRIRADELLELGKLTLVTLKQFRDSADASSACYQAVIEAACAVDRFGRPGNVAGRFPATGRAGREPPDSRRLRLGRDRAGVGRDADRAELRDRPWKGSWAGVAPADGCDSPDGYREGIGCFLDIHNLHRPEGLVCLGCEPVALFAAQGFAQPALGRRGEELHPDLLVAARRFAKRGDRLIMPSLEGGDARKQVAGVGRAVRHSFAHETGRVAAGRRQQGRRS